MILNCTISFVFLDPADFKYFEKYKPSAVCVCVWALLGYLIGVFLYFYSYLTALHIAADKAHYDVMDVLLKHGAKVCYASATVQ